MKRMGVRKQQTVGTAVYGSSLIVLSSLFYGSYGVWTRLMGNSFGPYMQAWIKAALVIAVMLPIALFGRQKWQPIRWRQDKWWLIFWVCINWMISAPLYYATTHIGINLSILLEYGGYLISMFFLGWLLNGERYTRNKLLATVLALSGLLLTFTPSLGHASLLPFLGALAAGFAIGGDMVVSQRIQYSSSQTTVLAWTTGLILNVPAAFILHEHTPGLHMDVHWLYLLLFVGVCIASSWLSIHGVKLIDAGTAGILGLLEVVWAMLFGITFFHERPHMLAYVGAVCIIAAAATPYVTSRQDKAVIEEQPV
jgi:drug/metabolite transporter (DMT)-like permease